MGAFLILIRDALIDQFGDVFRCHQQTKVPVKRLPSKPRFASIIVDGNNTCTCCIQKSKLPARPAPPPPSRKEVCHYLLTAYRSCIDRGALLQAPAPKAPARAGSLKRTTGKAKAAVYELYFKYHTSAVIFIYLLDPSTSRRH
jgi:hypothetical protein